MCVCVGSGAGQIQAKKKKVCNCSRKTLLKHVQVSTFRSSSGTFCLFLHFVCSVCLLHHLCFGHQWRLKSCGLFFRRGLQRYFTSDFFLENNKLENYAQKYYVFKVGLWVLHRHLRQKMWKSSYVLYPFKQCDNWRSAQKWCD